jgi:hypothetical protein
MLVIGKSGWPVPRRPLGGQLVRYKKEIYDMFATFLATAAVCVFVIANVIRQRKSVKMFEPTTRNRLVCCVFALLAGVTSANGLFHFSHGILGYSDFPAPFAMMVNNSLFTNISNFIWGLFNFSVATFVILSYRKSIPQWLFVVCFITGFIFIAFMLRFVLLAGYFQTHAI